jgi:hypothetical protein
MLMDSPLNKAGRLHVFIQTEKVSSFFYAFFSFFSPRFAHVHSLLLFLSLSKKNVLIEVSPHIRIPRTFKRFSGLMGSSLSLSPFVSFPSFVLARSSSSPRLFSLFLSFLSFLVFSTTSS